MQCTTAGGRRSASGPQLGPRLVNHAARAVVGEPGEARTAAGDPIRSGGGSDTIPGSGRAMHNRRRKAQRERAAARAPDGEPRGASGGW